jgi:uncharacterized protein
MADIKKIYKGPGDVPAVLPVFPLSGCLLLPRATLPLNIFEPRYLAMIDDALHSHRLIVLVQPARGVVAANDDADDEPGEGVTLESPAGRDVALRAMGCAGRITGFQELGDGRMIVSLTGITRCALVEEQATTKPYRLFQVSAEPFADDFVSGKGEEEVEREKLLATLKKFLAARNLRADWASVTRSPTEVLVNSLAVMSPYGPEEKQALLEAPTVKARAEMLVALAEMDLAANGGGTPGTTLQ